VIESEKGKGRGVGLEEETGKGGDGEIERKVHVMRQVEGKLKEGNYVIRRKGQEDMGKKKGGDR
jgi:hypothetical protein